MHTSARVGPALARLLCLHKAWIWKCRVARRMLVHCAGSCDCRGRGYDYTNTASKIIQTRLFVRSLFLLSLLFHLFISVKLSKNYVHYFAHFPPLLLLLAFTFFFTHSLFCFFLLFILFCSGFHLLSSLFALAFLSFSCSFTLSPSLFLLYMQLKDA